MSTNFPVNNELEFNKFLVREYLKFGSVDEVFHYHQHSLPISYAQYQRILDKWNIIKAAGPNSRLSEVVNFLSHMVHEQVPLDKLYKRMPPTFMTSAVTLYRVLSYIKEGITRRLGTGLIITPFDNKKKVLVGMDVSTPRKELGKPFGSISLPMGFSKINEKREDSILRVLQQEVFSEQAVEKKLPANVIPNRPKPFMYLDIADVRVEIFQIKLPKKLSSLSNFQSFKLQDYKYLNLEYDDLAKDKSNFRAGVREALTGYKKYLELKSKNVTFNPLQAKSEINYHFAGQIVRSE